MVIFKLVFCLLTGYMYFRLKNWNADAAEKSELRRFYIKQQLVLWIGLCVCYFFIGPEKDSVGIFLFVWGLICSVVFIVGLFLYVTNQNNNSKSIMEAAVTDESNSNPFAKYSPHGHFKRSKHPYSICNPFARKIKNVDAHAYVSHDIQNTDSSERVLYEHGKRREKMFYIGWFWGGCIVVFCLLLLIFYPENSKLKEISSVSVYRKGFAFYGCMACLLTAVFVHIALNRDLKKQDIYLNTKSETEPFLMRHSLWNMLLNLILAVILISSVFSFVIVGGMPDYMYKTARHSTIVRVLM